jgi:hypothetical protein
MWALKLAAASVGAVTNGGGRCEGSRGDGDQQQRVKIRSWHDGGRRGRKRGGSKSGLPVADGNSDAQQRDRTTWRRKHRRHPDSRHAMHSPHLEVEGQGVDGQLHLAGVVLHGAREEGLREHEARDPEHLPRRPHSTRSSTGTQRRGEDRSHRCKLVWDAATHPRTARHGAESTEHVHTRQW